jgi:hypothetical protein
MLKLIIKKNRFLNYLKRLGIDTEEIIDYIQTYLDKDIEVKKDTFDKFGNGVYSLTSFNIYYENTIHTAINEYLFKYYKEIEIFSYFEIDVKTLIATQNSYIERPKDLLNKQKQSSFTEELYKEDNFIRIALFENELLIEGTRIKENIVYFEGLVTIREKIYQFFESTPSDIWYDMFYSNNLYQIIGFYKYFNSIESKYTLWLDSHVLRVLNLKMDNYNNGLQALNDKGEIVLKYRCWKDALLGDDVNDNIPKLEGCDLLIRKDYYKKLNKFITSLEYFCDINSIS